MNQSTEKNSQTSKGEAWVKMVAERIKSEPKLRHIYFDELAYSIAGPSNKIARQEAVHYMTGAKPPVSKCGITMVKDILVTYIKSKTGINPYER